MMGKRVTMCLGASVLLFATAAVCFGDVAAQISKADKYVKAGNFSEAEAIYKSVIAEQQGSDDALKAQRKLITSYIHQDKTTEAQAGFDKMLADYALNPNLPEQIYWVGRGYRVAEDFDKAASIYQQVVQKAPSSSWANRSRINIRNMQVWTLIKGGQFEQAKTALGQMTQDFSGDSYLAEAMFWTARKFRQANQYQDAVNIYTQIIQKYPTDGFADKAVVELSNCVIQQLIEKGKDAEAIAAIGKLFTDNTNNPQVLSVASRIAELYQAKSREFEKQGNSAESQASLARSAAILDMIIKNAPEQPIRHSGAALLGIATTGGAITANRWSVFRRLQMTSPIMATGGRRYL